MRLGEWEVRLKWTEDRAKLAKWCVVPFRNAICPVDTQEVNQVDPGEEADDSASDSSDSDEKAVDLAQRKLQRISLTSGPEAWRLMQSPEPYIYVPSTITVMDVC